LSINVILFIFTAGVVWFSGTQLVVQADELAERYGLTRQFVGFIFLAAVTSLPELVTTLTGSLSNNAPLVLGNLFGGITFQTALLAIADLFFVRYALTSWPRKPTHALEAIILIVLLNVLLFVSLAGEVELFWGIGLGAIAISLAYPVAVYLLRKSDERIAWVPVDVPGQKDGYLIGVNRLKGTATRQIIVSAAISSVLILIAGYFTADRAAIIAEQTGLGSSFIGLTLLAAATSTPELSTTIAAVRMGAYTMAISNVFGSNLIMLLLILPADVFYRGGTILSEIDKNAQLAIVTGMLVTAIYAAGIIIRRTPRFLGAGVDSWLVLLVYFAGIFIAYMAI
jgi:cation:H+ antiporter